MEFTGTPRPALRWHHAESELDDFVIVSFRVPPERLAALLPRGFAPMRFDWAAGGSGALVSAVGFRDRDFHFRFCPRVAIACGQINYRAYVTRDGEPGVWFFRTALDHPLVAVPRHLWGMPWRRTRIRITGDWGAEPRWELVAGDAECRAAGVQRYRPDGLGEGWLPLLTHPTTGWYRGRRSVGTYSVWHPVMEPVFLAATYARFRVFEELGLVEPGQEPHSVLGQASIHFDVHVPPRVSA
ncbi:DUF2071 domain-containing protein [Herbidospora daliensis]|uniref:DUF2071 domain-containing protein n=1 Tax=Herbidospora daliensis TaxID=295585 RepID=UPI000780442E|nr:DUF2071 domain-containing protein [Herbidospora daliensis]